MVVSVIKYLFTAGWQSGYAAACKAVDAGSIPASASFSRIILENAIDFVARVIKVLKIRFLCVFSRETVLIRTVSEKKHIKTLRFSALISRSRDQLLLLGLLPGWRNR